MTPDELEELIADSPRLYHMAERGAWPSISRYGLLSTSALLDLHGVGGRRRRAIEQSHRPEIVVIQSDQHGRAAIRDQIPMDDSGLRRALPPEIEPSDWYAALNKKVFFWLTEKRLHRLTGAKAYREAEHEVLVLDARSIVAAHHDEIWLCPINSGCTKPMPHPRDFTTFRRISEYDYAHWRKARSRGERVVELCVDYAVPNVKAHLIDAYIIRGTQRLGSL